MNISRPRQSTYITDPVIQRSTVFAEWVMVAIWFCSLRSALTSGKIGACRGFGRRGPSLLFCKCIHDSLEGSPFGGHPWVVWAGRILEGGLCALHRALVNQTRNSWPATAVIQASWGIFFNFMKMNMALRIPFRPGLPANCLYIYGKMGRPWQEATEWSLCSGKWPWP